MVPGKPGFSTGCCGLAGIYTRFFSELQPGEPKLFIGRLNMYFYVAIMTDVHTKAQRSFNMSRIRAKNTKPELLVRRYLHSLGYRYTLHHKGLPGRPDIVLPRYQTIIFVHGCFWHGHKGCKYFKMPGTNTEWWKAKIAANRANDTKAAGTLRKGGWQVIVVWECGLKKDTIANTFRQLIKKLK